MIMTQNSLQIIIERHVIHNFAVQRLKVYWERKEITTQSVFLISHLLLIFSQMDGYLSSQRMFNAMDLNNYLMSFFKNINPRISPFERESNGNGFHINQGINSCQRIRRIVEEEKETIIKGREKYQPLIIKTRIERESLNRQNKQRRCD